MTNIHIGTAGWSYKDWIGSFYPSGAEKNFNYLNYYSEYFNCVEVNVTYYTYISASVVNGWINKVADNGAFKFTLKLHQDFTHKKNFNKENIKQFYSTIDVLNKAGMLGGLLFQFPYSFSYNSANTEYLRKLNDIFSGNVRFLELRHSSWLNNESMELLKELQLSLCSIDQPQIGKSVDFSIIPTSKSVYVRLHGRNTEAWKNSLQNFGKEQSYEQQSERYNYLYSPGEIVEIGNKIKDVYDKIKEVYVITNNHPHGNAVANAFEVKKFLEDFTRLKIPEPTLNTYPRLKKLLTT